MTSYDEILDLALISIRDYRLDAKMHESPADFLIILEGFMVRGLANFVNCTKSLNRDDSSRNFLDKLTEMEKSIIADWTVIMWLDKEINDVTQIRAMLQNRREAHRYSEANNLDAKQRHRTIMFEDVSSKQSRYSFNNNDWKGWADGNYGI